MRPGMYGRLRQLSYTPPAPVVVAPGAPQSLRTLGGGAANQINAAWERGSGGQPDQYEVWHRAGISGAFTLRGTTNSAADTVSFSIVISPSVINHYVYVVARNTAGSAQSTTMQVTIA